ncbi:peptide/nickel transport system ATP-binding protein [Primorskyibacter sedentarius]|uniref:Peptide/nickel transport system ATP-binding protein n=1 Tax=Primorskyibacter sedentarius TaxID=745311 RepID=A0A4R3J381_9RHOB|nr:oligopeptide/dipeptide ABC transporter ATP-binding protein [Primorskyibacter sedentarius]TCS59615.1 peptide/nickel transport system ATP-binding protein [Primorskyibacter sedentarius]
MSKPILHLDTLRMVYNADPGFLSRLTGRADPPVIAADDVTLELHAGETLAVVGESGSGKTTAGRIATLQERPTSGGVLYEGQEVTGLTGAALKAFRAKVQMIFQNPYDALNPRLTVSQSLAEPLMLHGLVPRSGLRAAVLEMLEAVELRPAESFADAFPSELSGGQLQRIAIARALIIKPMVVIADEPVSMLDVSIRSGVMNLMRGIQRDTGVTYLYITHDLSVARYMADRIAVMYLGAVLEEGPAESLISAAAHPYTRLLIEAAPEHRATAVKRNRIRLPGDAASQSGLPPGCRFHPRCPLAQPICREKAPPRAALGGGQTASCHFAHEVKKTGLATMTTA